MGGEGLAVRLIYPLLKAGVTEEIELPMRILVLGDFTLRPDECALEERDLIPIDKENLSKVMKALELKLDISVPDTLSRDPDKEISVTLEFDSLASLAPDAIAGKVPDLGKLVELRGILTNLVWPLGNQDEVLDRFRGLLMDEASSGAEARAELLLSWLMEHPRRPPPGGFMEAALAVIDRELSAQLDAVLHHPKVQKLESAWRSLQFLVNRTDFRENIKIDILNVSMEDLLDDFKEASEVVTSSLYKHVYTAEYGHHGGEPYSYIIANYDFGPEAEDIELLQDVAKVSAMSHAHFVAAAGPRFFGLGGFIGWPGRETLPTDLENAGHAERWRSFRETDDARHVALTLPRFLLRLPYGRDTKPVQAFQYEEDVSASKEHYLWGNAVFAFATRLTESFANSRWYLDIVGPERGGEVQGLPLHQFETMDGMRSAIPTEVLISDRRELELAEQGFIALTMRKGEDNACFCSANSVHKPKGYGEGPEVRRAETNYRLGTQLPYMSVTNRLAHYLKVIQRENLGSWQSAAHVQDGLQKWLTQYVSDQENPSSEVISIRPLRQAKVTVEEVPGEVGWCKVDLEVIPHLMF